MNSIIGIYNPSRYDIKDISGNISTEEIIAVRRRYIINGIVEDEKSIRMLILIGNLIFDGKDKRIHGFDIYDFLGDYREVGIEQNPHRIYIENGQKHIAYVVR